jgi:hypothetical protein
MLWGIYKEACLELGLRNLFYKGVPFWYGSTKIPCNFCLAPRNHPYHLPKRKIPQDLAGIPLCEGAAGSEAGDPKRD